MKNLLQAIPDVEVLLRLEPEELGAKLLFFMRESPDLASNGTFMVCSLTHDLWSDPYEPGPRYPNSRQSEVKAALAEAWAWLEAQGLLVPAEDTTDATAGVFSAVVPASLRTKWSSPTMRLRTISLVTRCTPELPDQFGCRSCAANSTQRFSRL